ncbi:3-carboxy-cis,cis-muconate cycloisomerase [Rhizobium paknamense]|uniref:3-carboxy-cis,cis-muconate cycloisomerase n=1 Tax=Rhizobium paknamense TaxID=1206817 RepID=A0ABU0IK43_9HYPH|nr:3-carboxy-cis,cis-muconate cycloisomerase [Rhizobium paknamense]MDQ0457805.1 3-carboxy-cis,cis-muconate cycloisomerase [Rhizobium paknamense]
MHFLAFDHAFLSGLLGDEDIAALFTAEADIAAMLAFERALAQAEAAHGVITPEDADAILAGLAQASPDLDALKQGTAQDGVVIPAFVKQLRQAVGGKAAEKVHFGATSQDVIDTSLMLRLKQLVTLVDQRLDTISERLQALSDRQGGKRLMGHTRMQAAIPITVAARIASWRQPLDLYRLEAADLLAHGFALQFGGAAGTLEKLGDKAGAVRADLARRLELEDVPQWQSQRSRLVKIGDLLARISGSLGKMGQDVALLAEMGGEIKLSGGGGSSAMPHKQNPVAAEVLVSLARFNALQIGGLYQSLVHEQERSGAAWTLEWLLLPQMAVATGAALRLAAELVTSIQSLGQES